MLVLASGSRLRLRRCVRVALRRQVCEGAASHRGTGTSRLLREAAMCVQQPMRRLAALSQGTIIPDVSPRLQISLSPVVVVSAIFNGTHQISWGRHLRTLLRERLTGVNVHSGRHAMALARVESVLMGADAALSGLLVPRVSLEDEPRSRGMLFERRCAVQMRCMLA
eukprot:scaffold1467_cov264-Pinguiococcus_pyrenoidosus.AAC.8